jgi:site-specific DNA recombinase
LHARAAILVHVLRISPPDSFWKCTAAGLHRALVHPATRDEAFAILRQLIERVTVHPREDGVEIGLQGEIVAMVDVALGSDAAGTTDNKAALRRLMLDDGSRRSVKVVAGRGFEPLTFRL